MTDTNTPIIDISRRKFMKVLVAFGMSTAGAAAITVPFTQKEIAEAAGGETDSDHRWTMIIDLNKCIGCEYCIKACQAVNNVPDMQRWNVYLPEKTETGETFHMTRPCLHCQDAPCADVCPTKATFQRGDGIVMVDYDRCIGCRYCMVACPYDVRRFNWDPVDRDALAVPDLQPEWGSPEVERRARGVVEKCTFCVHRIDRGLASGQIPGEDPAATPACVNICPVDARVFGDRNDPNSRVSEIIRSTPTFRLQEELGTDPNVFYVPAEGMVIQS